MEIGPGIGALVVWFVWAVAFWIGLPVALFLVVRRLLRALERRTGVEAIKAEDKERLLRLEERVEALADQHEQVAEAQRFTTDLLRTRTK